MGKDNPRVPVICMGKVMRKNSYPRIDIGKLVGKICRHTQLGINESFTSSFVSVYIEHFTHFLESIVSA